ncbi:MAG: prolipoprotein diacylglyceryl transferase [Clostridiales bacterium]|jgi:phosphatidylglycerol:prolipoprotein diacylglycerol transferase|nr:prolipoprotein diacylglyceryl transferase [Clostridiales bacterium]
MFPDFTLLGNTHPTYGTIGLAALVIGAAVAALRSKRFGFNSNDLMLCAVIASVFLAVGGVALHALVQIPILIQHRQHLSGDFLYVIQFLFGGMVFYGGLFGVFIGFWVYAKFFKKDFGNLLRFVVPVLPLAHGIMRLGCFAAGCCHGVPHDTLGIAFTRSVVAPNGVPFLPVQLYEAAMNFVIFAALWQFSKKDRKPLHLVCLYAMPYAMGRFALEFLRGDAARGTVFAVSTSQFISVIIILACAIALILNNRSKAALK